MLDISNKRYPFKEPIIEEDYILFEAPITGSSDLYVYEFSTAIIEHKNVLYSGDEYEVEDYGVKNSLKEGNGVFWIKARR